MIPDGYDEWTVADVREWASDEDDEAALDAALQHERENKDRVTAIDAIEEALDGLEPVEEDDDYESPSEVATTRVKVQNDYPKSRHIAGYSFDAGETKIIPNTPTVRTAIRTGRLKYIDSA